jgi:uncharacterized protein
VTTPAADDSSASGPPGVADPVALVDWRRRVFDLYARVRTRRPDDPEAAHRDWIDTRDALFRSHAETPLVGGDRTALTGLPVAAYDPAYAFAAQLATDVTRERFPVGTSGGSSIAFVRVGTVRLPLGVLEVFWLDAYGGGLFLPFRDATCGDTTYGGGRCLLDTVKGADLGVDGDGALNLDFNFAYHPSCHYAPTWSCPLAPPANWLDVPIPVGEQRSDR